jgi:hypothetical protein
VQIPIPSVGSVTLAVAKVRLTGTLAAHAPAVLKLRVVGPRGQGIVLLGAQHVQRSRRRATYTILIAVLRGAITRNIAMHRRGEPEPPRDVMEVLLSYVKQGTPGVAVDQMLRDKAEKDKAEGNVRVVNPSQPDLAKARPQLASLLDAPDAWDPLANPPLANDPGLDTGHYDDGHAFNWQHTGKAAKWGSDFVTVTKVVNGDEIGPALNSLYTDAGVSRPQAGYRCIGPPTVVFDNWNTDAVRNGATPKDFDTNGKPYCVTQVATYHWNDGSGKAPGTLWIKTGPVSWGPWKAAGATGSPSKQHPEGVPNAAWVATPSAAEQPVVVVGKFFCEDSDPTTWSSNAASGGQGFCRVAVQDAQKTGP